MFTRTTITVPSGATVEVNISGRYIYVESADYSSTDHVKIFFEMVGAGVPAMRGCEVRTRLEFHRFFLRAGTTERDVTIVVAVDPCVVIDTPGVDTPHPMAFPEAIFLYDADWQLGSAAEDSTFPTMIDYSGNGNHLSLNAGSTAGVVKKSGGLSLMNFPDNSTSYRHTSRLLPVLATNQALQIVLCMAAGTVDYSLGQDSNAMIFEQGGNESNATRYIHTDDRLSIYNRGLFFHSTSYEMLGSTLKTLSMNSRDDFNRMYLHFNETSLSAHAGGNVNPGQGDGPFIVGDCLYEGVSGIGNSAHRLAFFAAYLYDNSGYRVEVQEYAMNKYTP